MEQGDIGRREDESRRGDQSGGQHHPPACLCGNQPDDRQDDGSADRVCLLQRARLGRAMTTIEITNSDTVGTACDGEDRIGAGQRRARQRRPGPVLEGVEVVGYKMGTKGPLN